LGGNRTVKQKIQLFDRETHLKKGDRVGFTEKGKNRLAQIADRPKNENMVRIAGQGEGKKEHRRQLLQLTHDQQHLKGN